MPVNRVSMLVVAGITLCAVGCGTRESTAARDAHMAREQCPNAGTGGAAEKRSCAAMVQSELTQEEREHPDKAAKWAEERAIGAREEREEKRERSACIKQPTSELAACEARVEEAATKRAEERTAATPNGAKVRKTEEAVEKAPAELAAAARESDEKQEREAEIRGSREYGESQGR